MDDRQLHLQRLYTTAHGRVVRYRQIGESQVTQALREALQGTQRQMEHRLQAEQCLNQCIAVQPRAARAGSVSGMFARASSSIHIVMLPRLIRPALYAAQFLTRYFGFGSCVPFLSLRMFSRPKIENLRGVPKY